MSIHSRAQGWLAAGCLLLTFNATANAPNAAMRYVAVGGQSDTEHNQQANAALSLTIGEHAWAHVGAATTQIRQGGDTLNLSLGDLGMGVAGEHVMFTLDTSRRKDGVRYDQRDWSSSLEWRGQVFGVGVDGMHRNTDVQGTVPVATAQGRADVPVAESLRGNGVGLHARVNPIEQLTLSVAGMHYDYDVETRQAGAPSGGLLNGAIANVLNNRPLLAQQLLMQTSGVTRDAAVLQRSFNAGLGYRFDRVALAAQYFNDTTFDSDAAVNTVQVSAAFYLNEHWTVSPAIGHSSNDQVGGVTFGAVTASYGW
jgi:hypothetical protein